MGIENTIKIRAEFDRIKAMQLPKAKKEDMVWGILRGLELTGQIDLRDNNELFIYWRS